MSDVTPKNTLLFVVTHSNPINTQPTRVKSHRLVFVMPTSTLKLSYLWIFVWYLPDGEVLNALTECTRKIFTSLRKTDNVVYDIRSSHMIIQTYHKIRTKHNKPLKPYSQSNKDQICTSRRASKNNSTYYSTWGAQSLSTREYGRKLPDRLLWLRVMERT